MDRKKDLHVTTRKSASSGKFQADLEPAETLGLDAFAEWLGKRPLEPIADGPQMLLPMLE